MRIEIVKIKILKKPGVSARDTGEGFNRVVVVDSRVRRRFRVS